MVTDRTRSPTHGNDRVRAVSLDPISTGHHPAPFLHRPQIGLILEQLPHQLATRLLGVATNNLREGAPFTSKRLSHNSTHPRRAAPVSYRGMLDLATMLIWL